MRQLKFTVANLFFWLTLAIGSFYVSNLALLTSDPAAGFDFSCFWILTIAAFGCMIMYFYLEHKRNHLKIDKILLPLLIVATIIMLCTIWAQKGETFHWTNGEGENVVTFSLHDKIEYSVFLIFTMGFVYMCFYTIYTKRVSHRTFLWVAIAFLAYVWAAIIFSLVKEPDVYLHYKDPENVDYFVAQSFFYNPNSFAMLLFLGILTCFIINYYKPNWFTYICIPLFVAFIIFTNCMTSILVSFFTVLIYFIVDIIRHAKKKLVKTAIITGICLFIFACAFGVFFFMEQTFEHGYEPLDKELSELIAGFNESDLSKRTDNWSAIINRCVDNPWHLLFGRGFMTSGKYMKALMLAIRDTPIIESGSHFGENGFFYIFFSAGLFGLIPYLYLICYCGYCCFRLIVNKKVYFGILRFLIDVALISYNLTETINFFDMSIQGSYILIVFFIPPIVACKYLSHKDVVKETLAIKTTKLDLNPIKIGQIVGIVLLGLIGALAPVLLTSYSLNNPGFSQTIVFVIVGLGVGFFILPYLVSLWIDKESVFYTIINIIMNIVFLGVAFYVTYTIGGMIKTNNPILSALLITGGFILLDIVIYSFVRKDFFSSYLKTTIVEPIRIAFFPMIISTFISVAIGMVFQFAAPFTALTCLVLVILGIALFAIVLFLIPNRSKEQLFVYLNNNVLYNYKKYLEREQ